MLAAILACSGEPKPTSTVRIAVVTDSPDVWGLAVDDSRVYWTVRASSTGELHSQLLDGGDGRTLAVQLQYPSGVTVHDGVVYVASLGEGTIRRYPLDGGDGEVLFANQSSADRIAVDDQNVYWTRASVGELSGEGEILGAPLDGGTPFTVGLGYWNPSAVAVDDAYVYWAVRGVAVYGSSGAVTYPRGVVYRSAKDGGSPEIVAANLQGLHAVSAQGTTFRYAADDPQHPGRGLVISGDEITGKTTSLAVPADVWTLTPVDGGVFVSGAASPLFCDARGYLGFFPSDGGAPVDDSVPSLYGDAVEVRFQAGHLFIADPCEGVFRFDG